MHTQRWIAAATVLTVALATLAVGAAPAGATGGSAVYGASATLSGPVTTGHIVVPLSAVGTNMAAHGYEEQEYFASGTAHAFEATSSPSDGRLTVAPTTSAGYETRIIVRRPTSPKKFNGTVVVEWLNVSEGESSPDWDYLNPMLMRDGYAWVGVSAQALAIGGGSSILGDPDGRRPRARGAEPLRVPPPPRRPVRARYVRPDRPGPAPQSRGRRIRVPQPAPHRGHRRIPVGLLHDRLRRRPPAGHARLRRDLHPQSRRLGDPASARAAD